jgi:hypothetical protein
VRKFSTTFRTAHHWVTSQPSLMQYRTLHSTVSIFVNSWDQLNCPKHWMLYAMSNTYLVPKTYDMPVIKIQNNLKMHEKNATLFLIKSNTF